MSMNISFFGGISAGMIIGASTISVEIASAMLSLMASFVVLVFGFYVYIQKEWQLKFAITPLYISCLLYIAYTFALIPTFEASYLFQYFDSVGIISLVSYIYWNRRRTHHGMHCKEKSTKAKKESHTYGKTQKRSTETEEMSMI